jgi:PAS domain S-box-containing protein
LFGAISFTTTKRRVLWAKELVGQLMLLAEVFSNALMRKRAQEARFSYAAIVESSDDAIISKDLNGIILSWNASAQRLFGFSSAEAVGQPISILIPDELRPEEAGILQRSRAGERLDHYETIRLTKDGKRLHVSLTVSPLRDSAGVIVGACKIARDITERKRAEQVLRESEDRFRLVANSAPVLIWMSGTDRLCTFFNQGWLKFTGRTLEEELGDGWVAGVHPDDLRHCLATYSAAFDARADFEMEYRLRRFDGVYRWVVDLGVPRFEADATFCGYIGSCLDITERKSSVEALHNLTGRLIAAQEEERARIARELHDDFSQRLALLGIGLGQLWKKLSKSNAEEQESVHEMLNGTKEMSSDLHSLSHQLHSSKLEHVGLVSALRGLCREMSEKYEVSVLFSESDCPRNIPTDVALCLFRVAQEGLANVVKHSRSKDARVELRGNAAGISLRISDSGRGFDPRVRKPDAGIGMIGMTERLRLVGGRLLVKSEPDRGTEIRAEVPLAVHADEDQAVTQAAGS